MTLDYQKILDIADAEATRIYVAPRLNNQIHELVRVLVAHVQGELDVLKIQTESRLEDLERRVGELSK